MMFLLCGGMSLSSMPSQMIRAATFFHRSTSKCFSIPSIPTGIKLPPIMPIILNPCLIEKATKERCLNYNVTTINLAVRQLHFPTAECNLFGNDDFLPTGKDNHDFSDFGPCNTQQETNAYGSDDCVLVFPDFVVPPLKHDSPYGVLVPLAKELAGILDGNCTVEKLRQYKERLSNSIAEKEKQELTNRHHQLGTPQLPAGNMVSSSVPSNKRCKTHGIPLIMYSMLRNWVSSIFSGSCWAWQQDTWYKAYGLPLMKSIFSSHKSLL